MCCRALPFGVLLANAVKTTMGAKAKKAAATENVPASTKDARLVDAEDVCEARWKDLSDDAVKAEVGAYRTAIGDLEADLAKRGEKVEPSTFAFEETVAADEEGGDGAAADDIDPGAVGLDGEGKPDAQEGADDGLIEGNVDDIDPKEWMVPPQCIPVHANVVTYDWSKLYDHTDFDVIMMDTPWQLATANPTRGVSLGYSQLTDLSIADLPIPKLQKDGFLFVWVINAKYQWMLEQFKKWGYDFVDEVVWVKVTNSRRMAKSHGFYLQHAKEVCLVGRRGKDPPGMSDKAVGSDIIFAPRRGQSQKPTEIYELIEELVPNGRYLEIFARKNNLRDFWVSVGNEVTGTGLPPEDVKAFAEEGAVPGARYGAGANHAK